MALPSLSSGLRKKFRSRLWRFLGCSNAVYELSSERDQADACWRNYREYAIRMANLVDEMRADGFIPERGE